VTTISKTSLNNKLTMNHLLKQETFLMKDKRTKKKLFC